MIISKLKRITGKSSKDDTTFLSFAKPLKQLCKIIYPKQILEFGPGYSTHIFLENTLAIIISIIKMISCLTVRDHMASWTVLSVKVFMSRTGSRNQIVRSTSYRGSTITACSIAVRWIIWRSISPVSSIPGLTMAVAGHAPIAVRMPAVRSQPGGMTFYAEASWAAPDNNRAAYGHHNTSGQ